MKPKTVARNEMEMFLLGVFDRVFLRISPIFTERHFIHQTALTELQGKFKK